MTMTASSPNKTIAALIEDTLRRSQDPAFPLSLLVEASARIATLLDDAPNQLWLIAERGTPTEAESVRLGTLLENRYGRERARQLHQASINDFNISRTITKDDVRMAGLKAEMEGQVVGLTVAELETQITTIENEITDLNKTRRPQFDTRWKDVNKLRSIQMWRKKTLALVRRRVIDYLFAMEREVWLRAAAEDIMAGPQQEVESWLSARSPDALEQLRAAKRRADEGDVEARSHALTSLRRLIKSVADTVYPPLSHDVVCADGRSRPLGEGQYLNRLREFAAKRIASSTSRELMFSAFEDLDRRLDLAHDLSSKGVHGEVTQFEVRLCFMQTFFLVGEVITMSRMAPVLPGPMTLSRSEPWACRCSRWQRRFCLVFQRLRRHRRRLPVRRPTLSEGTVPCSARARRPRPRPPGLTRCGITRPSRVAPAFRPHVLNARPAPPKSSRCVLATRPSRPPQRSRSHGGTPPRPRGVQFDLWMFRTTLVAKRELCFVALTKADSRP